MIKELKVSFKGTPQTPAQRDELLCAIFGADKWGRYQEGKEQFREKAEARNQKGEQE